MKKKFRNQVFSEKQVKKKMSAAKVTPTSTTPVHGPACECNGCKAKIFCENATCNYPHPIKKGTNAEKGLFRAVDARLRGEPVRYYCNEDCYNKQRVMDDGLLLEAE